MPKIFYLKYIYICISPLLTFWGIQIMVPKPTDCSECLSWVNCIVIRGPFYIPVTRSFLLSQLTDNFWIACHSAVKKPLVLFSECVEVLDCYIMKRSRRVPVLSEVCWSFGNSSVLHPFLLPSLFLSLVWKWNVPCFLVLRADRKSVV